MIETLWPLYLVQRAADSVISNILIQRGNCSIERSHGSCLSWIDVQIVCRSGCK